MADIERLYQEMVQSNAAPVGSQTRSEADAPTHDSSDEHPTYAAQIADQIDAEEGQPSSDGNQSSILSVNSARITQSAEQVQQKSDKPSSNN